METYPTKVFTEPTPLPEVVAWLEQRTEDELYNILWAMRDLELDALRPHFHHDTHPNLATAMRKNDERVRWMREGIDGH